MIKIMPSEKFLKIYLFSQDLRNVLLFVLFLYFVFCIELVQSLVLKGLIASSHPGRSQPL